MFIKLLVLLSFVITLGVGTPLMAVCRAAGVVPVEVESSARGTEKTEILSPAVEPRLELDGGVRLALGTEGYNKTRYQESGHRSLYGSADQSRRSRRPNPSYGGTLPGSIRDWMHEEGPSEYRSRNSGPKEDEALRNRPEPYLVGRTQAPKLLTERAGLNAVGRLPTKQEGRIGSLLKKDRDEIVRRSQEIGRIVRLEIEVSHSQHTLNLFGVSPSGEKAVLFECRVGLGSRSFPTPKGAYFVTHIYDDDPWWIPPRNRAWAAGQSPSRRIYGGTMAPLLKKKSVRSRKRRKKNHHSEDKIAGKVKLCDYDYRFHGTNQPRSIGRNQSHGCVRMIPGDARRVAGLIKEYVGVTTRLNSENGSYVVLRAPVRLEIIR
jgi:hypothetical protein